MDDDTRQAWDTVTRALWEMLPAEVREREMREMGDGDAEQVLELLGRGLTPSPTGEVGCFACSKHRPANPVLLTRFLTTPQRYDAASALAHPPPEVPWTRHACLRCCASRQQSWSWGSGHRAATWARRPRLRR